jgi:hypothetical protein
MSSFFTGTAFAAGAKTVECKASYFSSAGTDDSSIKFENVPFTAVLKAAPAAMDYDFSADIDIKLGANRFGIFGTADQGSQRGGAEDGIFLNIKDRLTGNQVGNYNSHVDRSEGEGGDVAGLSMQVEASPQDPRFYSVDIHCSLK